MSNLVVVFLTGLTTGGLSCLAVQGGLLATSIAQQVEQDVQQQVRTRQVVPQSTQPRGKQRPVLREQAVMQRPKDDLAWPIILFLVAKILAATLLGLLLGGLGSVLQLTPFMRAILQFAVGVFMVGTALRMLNVHPIFRYFALEPPRSLTRYIRKTAKQGGRDHATPLFLGALTAFMPCGVTQAMMALAIGTGDPLLGAATMVAFTLGTTPVFSH